jgi:DOMON domain
MFLLTIVHSFCTCSSSIQDLFCINRGTLFDNPNVTTLSLEGPPVHSVHCLLDVPDCIASAFEILIPPLPTTPDLYQRGWRLNDASKMDVVALAQAVGICENCTDDTGMSGTVERGLYVSLTATLQDVGSADSPPIITASNIVVGNATSVPQCAYITRPPLAPTGGAPTAAPPDAAPTAPAPAPATGDILTIEDGLTLQSVDNGDNTATFTLAYEGEGWVALGISPTGVMVGSLAVIGLADGSDPVIYNLTSKESAGVVPAEANQQILTSSSFTQEGGISTLTFTVPMDLTETPFSVSSSTENGYVGGRVSGAQFCWNDKIASVCICVSVLTPEFYRCR